MQEILEKLIDEALEEAKKLKINIYTFAFYHDHESGFISICIDTESNSNKQISTQNKFNMKYFKNAIHEKDLSEASLWQANIGRNLSLGDFEEVNLVDYELPDNYEKNNNMYIAMINAINLNSKKIIKYCKNPEKLLFCCSTEKEEVGLTWVPY